MHEPGDAVEGGQPSPTAHRGELAGRPARNRSGPSPGVFRRSRWEQARFITELVSDGPGSNRGVHATTASEARRGDDHWERSVAIKCAPRAIRVAFTHLAIFSRLVLRRARARRSSQPRARSARVDPARAPRGAAAGQARGRRRRGQGPGDAGRLCRTAPAAAFWVAPPPSRRRGTPVIGVPRPIDIFEITVNCNAGVSRRHRGGLRQARISFILHHGSAILLVIELTTG